MPIFFIRSTDIQGSIVSLSPPLSFHLSKSLRIQLGHTIVLGDEQRRRHRAMVKRIEKNFLLAEIQETQIGPNPEVPSISLGQSVLKGEKMTWVIQKATELGISHLVPLVTDHVIPRVGLQSAKGQQDRWQRIALEAAQQSERWDVPIVDTVHSIRDFFATKDPKVFSLILVEREAGESLNSIPFPTQWGNGLTLLVGPEGGWTSAEVVEAEKRGYQKVSLGSRILRAETATLAALSILQSRLGHLGS